MVRELSGVTRKELLNQIFAPVVSGTEMTNIASHPACNIDHAGDYAYIALRVPNQPAVRSIWGFYIVMVGKAAITDMHFTVDLNMGGNLDDIAAADTDVYHQTTVLNRYHFTELLHGGNYGEIYGIKVYYNASANATNCYILGALLLWY